jgi:CheY-like chemotaxis protein
MGEPRCRTILVVEDDPDIREALAVALGSAGYEVATAANGRDGLAVLARVGRPCLILLDLMMPVMNGQEFLTTVRADQDAAEVPIVILSAYRTLAVNLSAQGFLQKPVDLGDLLGCAQRYCGPATA